MSLFLRISRFYRPPFLHIIHIKIIAMETNVTDKEVLTMESLELLGLKLLKANLGGYFFMQEPEFIDEVYQWLVDGPRDELLLRLAYIKYRFQQHGIWPKDWFDLYDKIKQNKFEASDLYEASGMAYSMKIALYGHAQIREANHDTKRPDSIPKSQPSTWRRILRFLSLE